MKRQVIFFIAILFSTMVFAQDSKANKGKERTPEQIAQARTNKWTRVLSLTQEQVPQVKAILLEKIQKMKEVKAQKTDSTDKKALHQQLKTIKKDSDARLKEVLTQEQYDLYVKTKQENRKKAEKANQPDLEEDDDL